MVQVHVPATVWGFESLRWHQKYCKGMVESASVPWRLSHVLLAPLGGLAKAVPFEDDP
jgi:hypothetical protein